MTVVATADDVGVSVVEDQVPEAVVFEHHFFNAVAGSFFRKCEGDRGAVMVIPYESTIAELSMKGLKRELDLQPESADGLMLKVVEMALNYVPCIRINDKVPSELHSGKASWKISHNHRALAKARISMQLVSWLWGDENVVTDMSQLAMVAEDPNMKAKINEAFGKAAVHLGMRLDQREEVVNLVDELSEELAYIEALRSQFEFIQVVQERLFKLAEVYSNDRSQMETIIPAKRMCKGAFNDIQEEFADLDAQTGEIMAVLKNMTAQIKFIRKFRDDMYRRFWAWEELAEKWVLQPAQRSRFCEELILETYHFLAQRFLPQDEWELVMNTEQSASSTRSVW